MRAIELRERSEAELRRLLEEKHEVGFRNRLKNATHQLTNTADIRKNRREIACIETVLRERDSARSVNSH